MCFEWLVDSAYAKAKTKRTINKNKITVTCSDIGGEWNGKEGQFESPSSSLPSPLM